MESTALRWHELDWADIFFFTLTPLAAIVLVPLYVHYFGLSWNLVLCFVIYATMTSLCITAGYHRMLAHRSYHAKPWLTWFYLIVGAGAFQGPAVKWCSDHRRHHRYVDTNGDPYSIKRGFFYAHIGWLFLKENTQNFDFAPDLERDPWLQWQNKYYIPLAIFMAFFFPAIVAGLIGGTWVAALGGLLIPGCLRVVVTNHATFFINSACHYFGKQPYNDRNSARDSFVMALLTFGEGYHNYHHQFAADYRNGVRWYNWDPTKWSIRLMSFFGVTYRLKNVPDSEILKAQMQMDQRLVLSQGASPERLNVLKQKVEEAQANAKALRDEYRRLKANMQEESRKQMLHLKREIKVARSEFKVACAQWYAYIKSSKELKVVPAC